MTETTHNAGMSGDFASFLAGADLPELLALSARSMEGGGQRLVSYSRKVFIPLTRLCRDVCHYCTFASVPRHLPSAYLTIDEVLEIAQAGRAQGCKEALFTLGDRPEARFAQAREALAEMGFATTIDYVVHAAGRVLAETGLLPHVNAGTLTEEEIARLRPVSASMGLMLESTSARLLAPGGAHHGSPDKVPARRIETLARLGRARVPTTTGILIGIGETRRERIEALLEIRRLHREHGHIQEVIVQNFRAKPGTRMAKSPEPSREELLRSVAAARLILGTEMNIQVPPNLSDRAILPEIVAAGINDWGGVSPVTADHVNPEAPWPEIETLREETARAGAILQERLTIYPAFVRAAKTWLDAKLGPAVLRLSDGEAYARQDGWHVGEATGAEPHERRVRETGGTGREIAAVLAGLERAEAPGEAEIVTLLGARGGAFRRVCAAADALRRRVNGEAVTYVVNRNINYTNICHFGCRFCAFSRGKTHEALRGRPYDLELSEIRRRAAEAWDRGATEVCMQGGIHPHYTGRRYLDICAAIREETPGMHIHAFSPLEIRQGAASLGLGVEAFLRELRDAGLDTLPGTAAEILDDEVRAVLCPDKLNTREWLEVMEIAHGLELRTTATMMFGHVERPVHVARHLLRIRELQARTGGFTEFVPLPFVSAEAPIFLKGAARRGPTYREAILLHAVARLVLHPGIASIQASWVKLGPEGVADCLRAGVNDLGGTLMNESISRAAGAAHGQEFGPAEMEALIRASGRTPRMRMTLYGEVPQERRTAAYGAGPLVTF